MYKKNYELITSDRRLIEKDDYELRTRENERIREIETIRILKEKQKIAKEEERLQAALAEKELLRIERERVERKWFTKEQSAQLRINETRRVNRENRRIYEEEQRMIERIRLEKKQKLKQKREIYKKTITVKIYFKYGGRVSDKLYDMVIAKHDEISKNINLELIGVTPESKKGCQYNRFPVAVISIENDGNKYSLIGLKSCSEIIIKIKNKVEKAIQSDMCFLKNTISGIVDYVQYLNLYNIEDNKDDFDLDDITEMNNKNTILLEKLEHLELLNKSLMAEDPQPSEGESPLLCMVCMANCRTHIFDPCGHFACCTMCAEYIDHDTKKCPICKIKVESIKKIFIV